MNCGEYQTKALTADAVEELQIAFRGKTKVCESGNKIKAGICIQPDNVKDVKDIVSYAVKHGFAVTSSNNPEWTIGAKKTQEGSIFVCLRSFTEIGDVDPVAMSIRVGAGAKWKDVVEKVSAAGFTVGSRPSDLDRSVGAWVVTNGVGVGSYKYGSAKDNVLSVQAVTNELVTVETGYDNIGYYMSGYNLTQLFSGSEGTLGIVTAVTLKLAPAGVTKAVAYQFADYDAMDAAIQKLVHHPSIKPMDISFCSAKKNLLLAFQGAQEFVDLEEAECDEMLEGATKISESEAKDLWTKRYDYKRRGEQAIVPVKNWGKLAKDISGNYYGSIPDRSSAVFTLSSESFDAIGEKAKELGGRKITGATFDWTPYFLGPVEEPDLERVVTPEIIEKLKEIVGAKNVTTEGVDLLLYSKDMAPLPKMAGLAFNNLPDVVVRPSTVEEVSKIVALAYKNGVPIIPRGNSSWGLGGCQPANRGIVIDMSSKFNNIIKIDKEGMAVKVGCGCTWKHLLDTVMKEGYIIGSYPSSFPSATLGAWLSTNGMGVGSYKYGSAKDNVLNMEAVLCDGTVLTTGNDDVGTYYTGYNLNQIFSGSEGTLAVFATVTFKLHPMGIIKPLAYEFDKLDQANGTIQKIVNHPSVRPLHVAWSDEMHFANQRKAGVHAPNVKNLLLVTLQGDEKFVELEEKTIDAMVAEEGLGRKITDEALPAHEWDERCYEFRARKVGVGEIPAEVIVPAVSWGTFVGRCYEGFEDMKMEPGGVIGVLVDRNTSLFMPYYFKDDEGLLGMTAFGFNFYLGDVAMEYGGRTTGFGIFFAWNLDNIHDADTVAYMRKMKTVLDPHDVVNPGHVVCGMTRFGINMSKQLMGLGSGLIQLVKKMLPKNKTFSENRARFRYNKLEERKEIDRSHELGNGSV